MLNFNPVFDNTFPALNLPAMQPQSPTAISTMQQFAQSPQGNAALMAFANAALQASMNPQSRGGVGLLNALSHGLSGYKASDEAQTEKAWKTKQRGFQERQMAHEETTWPTEEKIQQHQVKAGEHQEAEWMKPEEAYKKGQIVDWSYEDDQGRHHEVKKSYQGLDAKGNQIWNEVQHKVGAPQAQGSQFPSTNALAMIAAGQIKENPWGLNAQGAKAVLDMLKQYQMNNPLMQLLFGGSGGGGGGGMPMPAMGAHGAVKRTGTDKSTGEKVIEYEDGYQERVK